MDRRKALCGVVAFGLLRGVPHAVSQRPARVFRIGYLNLRAGPNASDEGFVQRLRELGYDIGRDLIIEYRWADNDLARLKRQADELVRLPVDVIVTAVTPAVRIAKKATAMIPIVMVAVADPVGTGLIASFARPGGNLTGLSFLSTDLAGKRLELLREIVPGATRIALLAWGSSELETVTKDRRPTERFVAETEAAGRLLAVEVRAEVIGSAADLPGAFAAMERARAQALIVQASSLTYEHRGAIIEASKRLRLPDMYESRELVASGGLVSYGPSVSDLYRQAAVYVDKILRGAPPGDLAVEQPSKLELVINLQTAKALSLAIPQSLLLRADEVIQ